MKSQTMATNKLIGVLIIFLATIAISVDAEYSPVIVTKSGAVRGHLVQIPSFQDVYEFIGIPFAEPPIGERRFRKPVPKAPWNDGVVLDAITPHPACIQMMPPNVLGNYTRDYLVPGTDFSEDCLYLNIWVPRKAIDNSNNVHQNKGKLPVFSFIFGGGFVTGAPMLHIYNGTVLAAFGDIIVTSIGYRVGSLGFAYFGNEEAPGNMGLWDQLEGIKWIHENVEAFGGDSNAITIGGESAGAVSVTCLILSPHSRGYFHRAIIQSGTAVAAWGSFSDEKANSVAKIIAEEAAGGKCKGLSALEQIKCLKTVPVEEFPKVDYVSFEKGFSFGFAPVVDGDFLPRHPREMLLEGDFSDIPLLIGVTNDEGSLFTLFFPEALEFDSLVQQDGLNMTHSGRLLEIFIKGLSASHKNIDSSIIQTVQLLYWPKDQDSSISGREITNALVQATGDFGFTCPTLTWAEKASAVSTVKQIFAYNFNERSPLGLFPEWMGVLHGEELAFMFGEPLAPYAEIFSYSEDAKRFSKAVMSYWVNFIQNGDPNGGEDGSCDQSDVCNPLLPVWPTFLNNNCPRQILEISMANLLSKSDQVTNCGYKVRECLFWDDVFHQLSAKLSECS